MSKQTINILIFFLIIFLLGCDQKVNKDSEKIKLIIISDSTPVYRDLYEIKKIDTLFAGIIYGPISYFLYRGNPRGFDYELIKKYCKDRNLHLKLIILDNLEDAFEALRRGEIDIIAKSIPITKVSLDYLYPIPIYIGHQVLVQRRTKKRIKSVVDLIGKTVYVPFNSPYAKRLKNLSEEIGGDINIVEKKEYSTEDLIELVAQGDIDYTVTDLNIAQLNASYYGNLDISVKVSFPQRIGWYVRKSSTELIKDINQWLAYKKKNGYFSYVYRKYFELRKNYAERMSSNLIVIKGKQFRISKYDDKIKKWAKFLKWDWLLLASLIYAESKFNPYAKSWSGALGLMQIMPELGLRYGIYNLVNVDNNLYVGALHLKDLQRQWQFIPDSLERLKFILASYNAGSGHIHDARRLAQYFGDDPNKWTNSVEKYAKLLSLERYYNLPIIRYGYLNGAQTYHYVRKILEVYKIYKDSYKIYEKHLKNHSLNKK